MHAYGFYIGSVVSVCWFVFRVYTWRRRRR
jgi:hypothetical protein